MSKTYQRNFAVRMANGVMKTLIRLGLAPRAMHILTVRGRKSGRLYSTPVTLVEDGTQRWLVAPYGNVPWVQNARVAGLVTLARGRNVQEMRIVELNPCEAAPVLKKYLAVEPFTKAYFDASADADETAFLDEAARHPVFRLQAAGSPA